MTGHFHRLSRTEPNLRRRAAILDGIRDFFRREGFLEVETPLLMATVIPERHIAPFSFDRLFLSTSPEYYMKQLLAAGYERIFQICHSFRRYERGDRHQPEFTILEWYRAGADYLGIVRDTGRLVLDLATRLGVAPAVSYRGNKIDLTLPWPGITVRDAFLRWAGWDPITAADAVRFELDLVERVIPGFPGDRPTVLLDYPAAESSLSRLKPGDRLVAERAEVFIGGLEMANAYSELNDAAEQETRFRREIDHLERQGKHGFKVPRRLLDAVARLPDCGGVALGIDRLAMLFCDAASIEEVIAFPWEDSTDSHP